MCSCNNNYANEIEQENMNLGPYKTVEPAIEQVNRDYAFYVQNNLSPEELVLIEEFRGGRGGRGHGGRGHGGRGHGGRGHGGRRHGRHFRPWRPWRRPWVGGYIDPQPVYYPIYVQNQEAVQCISAEQCQPGESCSYQNGASSFGYCGNWN